MHRLSASVRLAILACVVGASACDGCHKVSGPTADLAGSGEVKILDESFERLFTLFLWHSSMPESERAALWTKYAGRWVRWEGVLMSFNDHGVTVKHLLGTSTFDVSLTCDRDALQRAKREFHKGERIRYLGRLDTYDDIFRTLYLTHGVVLEKLPPADLGEPADLAHPPVDNGIDAQVAY
jgi:hypothetical protein